MRKLTSISVILLAMAIVIASCQKEPELTLTSSPSVELSVDGSSGTITFTANRDWSVSSSDSWVSVSPSHGVASDKPITVNVSCNANTTYDDRMATVSISMEGLSQVVTVRQPANKGIILPKQVFDIQSDSKSIDVEVQANVQYSISTSVNWIKHINTKGLTSNTLTFSIEENTSYDSREGTITIKSQEGNIQEQVISVRQAKKDAINVEKTSYEMPYGGGEVEIKVESNVSFDITPSANWIHYVQTKALNSSTVVLKIDENRTYSSRQGTVEFKQQNGNLKHTITINQAGLIAVTSVELDQVNLSIYPGETAKLTATVKPENATDKTITWYTSEPSIAKVDNSGTVTALREGSAIITAKSGDKTAVCNVQVCVVVSSIQLNKTYITIYTGETYTLVATVKPDNATDKTVNWTSTNEEIASVDENGKVTAVKKGVATILAKAGNRTAECRVVVKVPVSSIELNKSELTLYEGEEEYLSATIYPEEASDETIIWRSSDYTIANLYSNGKVIALKGGVATITAKAGDKTAECKVTVCTHVSSVQLDKTELTLKPDDSYTLNATVYPENATDKTVTWSSSDPTIVSVDETGKIYALKEGTVTITAQADGKSATCKVIVLWAPDDAVNLGIVMTRKDGTKYNLYWAKCNLGASVPEENGSLFAWGEVEETIQGGSYKFFHGSVWLHTVSILKYNTSSEYGSVDNKTVLEPEDDAAHVLLGGDWRMPTMAEFSALIEQCTWTWTTMNGKEGFEVKSKICSNSIFLPAVRGIIDNSTGMGIYGFYWTSTLDPDPTGAYGILFNQGGVNIVTGTRYYGLTVRPVTE